MAARLLERWRARQERVDVLLESLPVQLSRTERARVQALLYGAVRHLGRVDSHLIPLLAHPPRTIVWAGLQLAGYELIEGGGEGHAARVGHHAVEQMKRLASPKEARLVNAIVRKLAAALAAEEAPGLRVPTPRLAAYFSHPEWLVDRWWSQLGPEATRALLEWNQRPGPVFARWRRQDRTPDDAERAWLHPVSTAPGFYAIDPGHWEAVQPLLQDGSLQVQDPATRLAVTLLNPQPGEDVIDLCAAPGGKSLALADAMQRGRLIALDLPGARLERLAQNLAHAPREVTTVTVAGDLRIGAGRLLAAQGMPTTAPAVLLDVPCSNTGVMRHRVDVKWRLQPTDFRKHASQQFDLLESASRLVAPGGRLVYSSCSIDAEENERVVDAFVRRSRGAFERTEMQISRPWETAQDGAAAFLLRRG